MSSSPGSSMVRMSAWSPLSGLVILTCRPSPIVGCQAQPVGPLVVGEAVGDHLGKAGAHQQVLDLRLHALGPVEAPPAGPPGGQSRRDLIQTMDAGDLLDEVDLSLEIGAEARHRHQELFAAVHSPEQPRRVRMAAICAGGHGDAQHLLHPVRP